MKTMRYFRCLWLTLVLLAFSPSVVFAHGAAQKEFLAKDRDVSGMGEELNEYLNKITSKHGIIIYGGCNTQFGTDIFIVSNALKQGLLLEFDDGKFSNMAFVDLQDNDGIVIGFEGMMGGQWTIHRAQNNIDQIVKMPFHIFLGKNPAELFDMKFPGKCEDYKGR